MVIFFAGLPGTIKFISEFYLFTSFFEISPFMCILLMFLANVCGLIGFSKCWFNSIFGINKNYKNFNILDLTVKEILIILFSLYFLFIFSFFPSFLI
jgi:NADH:ubiquinone oxidoreductase subunit 4 (subunit M)